MLTFKRFLTPADPMGYVIKKDYLVPLVWAFGYPDRTYHGSKNRGS